MPKAIIKLSIRREIGAAHQSNFEADVFNDTYSELQLQAQVYNKDRKFTTLQQIIENEPKAVSLHYKTGFAIGLYVKSLNNRIPGTALNFDNYDFAIVESDLTNKTKHKIALTFFTTPLILVNSFADYLVLAKYDGGEIPKSFEETMTIKLNESVGIVGYTAL